MSIREESARLGVLARLVLMMILVGVLPLTPAIVHAQEGPLTVESQNPDTDGPGNVISRKDDGTDTSYHLVARVGGGSSAEGADVTATIDDGDDGGDPNVTVTLTNVAGATDTYEAFLPDSVTFTSGDGGVTYTASDSEGGMATETLTVAIADDQETVEITNPANGGEVTFADLDGDGAPEAEIEGTSSTDTTSVALYYTTATASSEPTWLECGLVTETVQDFSGKCEVAPQDDAVSVTMVAARAFLFVPCFRLIELGPCIPPTEMDVDEPHSGDAHRVIAASVSLQLDAEPETDTNATGTVHPIGASVTDGDGGDVSGSVVSVEYEGANDPDAGNTPETPDDQCETGEDGTCEVVLGDDDDVGDAESTLDTGRTTATVWAGGEPDVAESRSAEDDDGTDVVIKDWAEPPPPATAPRADTFHVIPEGAAHSGFTTFLTLANPNTEDATADVTFLTPAGPVDGGAHEVPGNGRLTINVNAALGDEADVATKVESDLPIAAAASIHKSGSLANFVMDSASETSSQWILAEGHVGDGFTTFVTIANPDEENATAVDITLLKQSGAVELEEETVTAGGRITIDINTACGCPGEDVSTLVTTSGSGPDTVAALSIHRTFGDLGIGGAIGATSSEDSWVVAEGATHNGFQTFVLVSNPTSEDATVDVTYMTRSSGSFTDEGIEVPAESRRTIHVNPELNEIAEATISDDVSILVDSVTGTVVVEGSIQKADASGFVIADSLAVPGSTPDETAGQSWLVPEGVTHNDFTTFVLISNPTDDPSTVSITYLRATGPPIPGGTLVVGAKSRETVSVNTGCGCSDEVATRIEVTNGPGVVVEGVVDRVTTLGFSKARLLGSRLD